MKKNPRSGHLSVSSVKIPRLRAALALVSAVAMAGGLNAKTTYVSGGDGNLQTAINNAAAGDTLIVNNGTYSAITVSKKLIIKTANHLGATISSGVVPAVKMQASYVTLQGFIITSSHENGVGDARGFRNFAIRQNRVLDCGKAGLGLNGCDVVTFADNRVERANSNNPALNFSGIKIFQPRNIAGGATRSISAYGNTVVDTFGGEGNDDRISDGNGIQMDDFKNAQKGSTFPPYTKGAIVRDNECRDNFGPGLTSMSSQNITFDNNVSTGNKWGINVRESSGVSVLNNTFEGNASSEVRFDYKTTNSSSNGNSFPNLPGTSAKYELNDSSVTGITIGTTTYSGGATGIYILGNGTVVAK